MEYPIAQLFTSPQGEGFYVGALMRFIRLAGCNVGKYEEPVQGDVSELRVLRPEYSICTSALGDRFVCDTNYKSIGKFKTEDALGFDKFRHVCITGGEPFMHNLAPMIEVCRQRELLVHIETSGTKPIPDEIALDENVWITCAPKAGFLPENRSKVNEWKFLVTSAADPAKVVADVYKVVGDEVIESLMSSLVYICPINNIETVDQASMAAALTVQRLEPRFLIGVQLHKFIGVE